MFKEHSPVQQWAKVSVLQVTSNLKLRWCVCVVVGGERIASCTFSFKHTNSQLARHCGDGHTYKLSLKDLVWAPGGWLRGSLPFRRSACQLIIQEEQSGGAAAARAQHI